MERNIDDQRGALRRVMRGITVMFIITVIASAAFLFLAARSADAAIIYSLRAAEIDTSIGFGDCDELTLAVTTKWANLGKNDDRLVMIYFEGELVCKAYDLDRSDQFDSGHSDVSEHDREILELILSEQGFDVEWVEGARLTTLRATKRSSHKPAPTQPSLETGHPYLQVRVFFRIRDIDIL